MSTSTATSADRLRARACRRSPTALIDRSLRIVSAGGGFGRLSAFALADDRDCVGMPLARIAPEAAAAVASLLARGGEEGALEVELKRRRPGEPVRAWTLLLVPIGDPGQAPWACAIAASERTEELRRRAEQERVARELERSDALKTTLLRGVTHEFRNPLTGIANAADALLIVEDPRERASLIEAVLEETRRLERLVANLLDLSRLEGGVLSARCDWCSAEELVAGALGACGLALGDVDLSVDLDPAAPLVMADPVLTERILVNLLHNAVRHGSPPIHVRARVEDGEFEVSVEDHGSGVHPDVLPSVFEPFIHREGEGLGLGLPLCRRLAEAQGGRLEHRRGARGACFVLRLPLTPVPELRA